MRGSLLILVALLLAACVGTPVPYAEVGVGVQLNSLTDYWLQTDRSWQCDNNLSAHFAGGLEWDNKVKLGIYHDSWWFCGGPFNDKPEVWQAGVRLTKKIGGK